MKKLSKLLIAFMLSLTLVACNTTGTDTAWVGKYDKNVYTNDFFGFKLTYPEASKYKDQKALEAERDDDNKKTQKVAEINDFEGIDMVIMITNDLKENHTIDEEIENVSNFYIGSGFMFQPIELTKEVAGQEYRLFTMKMARSDRDQDIYYRIHNGKLLTIHVSYPEDKSDLAKEMMNWYEGI